MHCNDRKSEEKINTTNDQERKKKIISKLRMIDDIFFQKMFEDIKVCQEILRICMENSRLEVLEVMPQKDLKNLQGRSVRLDVHCKLGDGRYVDVEVQRGNNDDHLRRVRYNGSCLTVNIMETGTDFRKVPDVCVIYITEFDLFQGGRTVYHVNKVVQETGKIIDDGLKEIYLNAKVDDGSIQAALMQNFILEDVSDERFPEVSRRFYELKHSEVEVTHMCKELQEYYAEGREEGREEGHLKEKAMRDKLNVTEISELTKIPIEEVLEILKEGLSLFTRPFQVLCKR